MGSQYGKLSDYDREFIADQKMFFIASSSNGYEVNLSPRGYDCFRIINDNEAFFLDYAGSGNRTARDIKNDGELTLMFCSFGEKPKIIRLFCKGELIENFDSTIQQYFASEDLQGMRRFVKLYIYCVEHSCGMSVPRYDFISERSELKEWCRDGANNGDLDEYIRQHETPPDLNSFKNT